MEEIRFFEDAPQITAGFSTRGMDSGQVREELVGRGYLVVRTKQVHKDTIGIVTEEVRDACLQKGETEKILLETDALVNNCSGVAISTVHADCLPVWLYDPESGAMGMAHAGWRGTYAGIAAKMARTMVKELSASLDTMRAAIGPGISLCCFEVGPEVYEQFQERYDFIDQCARKMQNGKYHLDLKEINRRQLSALGINRIETSLFCTACSMRMGENGGEELHFYSYRREKGENEGQMAAYIYRNKL